MELQGILPYIFFHLCLFLITGNFTSEFTIAGNIHHQIHKHGRFRPTKLFVFGDSYADTGNNPKAFASSWKPPYGVTFPGKPAGRYSDGRVFTDYLARFMGIRSPLPYKFRKYAPSKLRGGLNFAYGGTGVFDTGNLQPNLTTQIGFLQGLIKERVYTKRDLKASLALVAISGNDYGTYTSTGGSEQGLPSFISQVVNQFAKDLKLLHDTGVPRVLVTTLQPIGCLPTVTVSSSYQQCNVSQNSAAGFHNQLLQQAVAKLNNNTKDSSFLILDIFSAFNTVLKSKKDFTATSDQSSRPSLLHFPWLKDDEALNVFCNKTLKAPDEEIPAKLWNGSAPRTQRTLRDPGLNDVICLASFGLAKGTADETSVIGTRQLAKRVFDVTVKQLSQ